MALDLIDRCQARTGRRYPDGYGFALAFLDNRLDTALLRNGAFAVVAKAFRPPEPIEDRHGLQPNDDDLLRFVAAYGAAERFEDYAVEAAQLVLQAALVGDRDAGDVMARCGHPGYTIGRGSDQ